MYKLTVPFNGNIPQKAKTFAGWNNILLDKRKWNYLQKYYNMTDREFQIARLACEGFNNDQIAKYLTITNGTVKTHLRNIYRKTWVNNKVSMLLRFVNDTRDIISRHRVSSDHRRINNISKRHIQHSHRDIQGQKK